jgi:hypothetical protein
MTRAVLRSISLVLFDFLAISKCVIRAWCDDRPQDGHKSQNLLHYYRITSNVSSTATSHRQTQFPLV